MSTTCPNCRSDNPETASFCADCGTRLGAAKVDQVTITKTMETPAAELSTGSVFTERYQIIEVLGLGGMGRVYRALDKKLNEEVALKLIKPEIAADKKTLTRFSNELRLARKISHKNIGRMYELMEEAGTHFITMEYIRGQDLKGLIRQSGRLAVETATSLAKQICEGLAEAHRLGVVHRDLKPSNVMIDKEGSARIMDFGIARTLSAKGITGAGVMIGTPEYMSPEQVEGGEIDHRSDIYSLGVMLYEMVTGRVPFEGETSLSIARKHTDELPLDPKKLNPQIPDGLAQVILRCLEKNREKRFADSGEVYAELDRVEKGFPVSDTARRQKKPITSKEITVTFGLRKLIIPAVVFVAVIAVGVILWQVLSQKKSASLQTQNLSVAVLPFEDLSPQKDLEYLCDGMADELINRLTNIERLRVPARTSSFYFKGKDVDIKEISEKLKVKNVLEGSVRRAGNNLSVTVQLVNAEDGYLVWSEKYERDKENFLALQEQICLAITDKLKLEFLGEEKEELVKLYTENHEAYDLYWRGQWLLNTKKGILSAYERAVDYFQKAIEKDPQYVLPYVGIAYVFTEYGTFFYSPKEAYSEAKKWILKALEIDDSISKAHALLGEIYGWYERNWEAAEGAYKRAIELSSNDARAHLQYSYHLLIMGRFEEALKEARIALEFDPLEPNVNASVGVITIWDRQYEEAIELLRKAVEMNPTDLRGHIWLGNAYCMHGMYPEAINEFQKVLAVAPDMWYALGHLGWTYAVSGEKDKALEVLGRLEELSKGRFVSFWMRAFIYLELGNVDQAFDYFEKADSERETLFVLTIKGPWYDKIRFDPRYKALLKKMNLD